ncbi:MAG: FHA domain-containing protein [Lachnospiraceae bacterium]|nr:FHA domain-containing protein [Lachnospiraceae bacterium]
MEAEYRQDLCKRTMVVKRTGGEKRSFREKMVIKNSIRGLAKLNIRFLNGESCYSYDMGSCQTLRNVFEGNPISFKELKALFSGIIMVSEEIGKFLLDAKDLMMEPEHIFWDLEKGEPVFCYYPENPEGEEGYYALGQFLIDTADKKDEEAVKAAYDYFDRISEGILLPGDFFKGRDTKEDTGRIAESTAAVSKEEKTASGEKQNPVFEGNTNSLSLSKIWTDDENYYLGDSAPEKEGEKKSGKLIILLSFIPAVIASAAYAYVFLNPSVMRALSLSDRDYIRGGIAVMVISGLFITLGIYIWNKRKKEEEDREKDMDSLNSDIRQEEFLFDPLEEKIMERTGQDSMEDSDATVLLSDLSGGGRKSRIPFLSGRIGGEQREYRIEQTPYMIGKMRNKADAVLPDPKVSRIHACIREEGGRYFLSDLNSTNGTAVNERILKGSETAELFDGDMLRFADVTLTFRLA